MRSVMTVSVPKELEREVRKLSRKLHTSKSDIVKTAVQRHIWSLKFRALRAKTIPHARRRGIFTDEDVFKLIS